MEAFHIYPTSDYKEHKLEGVSCICKPTIKIEDDTLIIHNSFDGRENKEMDPIEAYGKEIHRYYEGTDPGKKSMIYHSYLNYTSKDRQPFNMDQILDIRSILQAKIERFKVTGKEEIDYWPEYCEQEIAGCDLLLKLLIENKAY